VDVSLSWILCPTKHIIPFLSKYNVQIGIFFKVSVAWDVMLSSTVEIYCCLRLTYCLHYQATGCRFFQTSVHFYQTTWHYIWEDSILNSRCHENEDLHEMPLLRTSELYPNVYCSQIFWHHTAAIKQNELQFSLWDFHGSIMIKVSCGMVPHRLLGWYDWRNVLTSCVKVDARGGSEMLCI
jgi:hypothetical protein